MQRIFEEPPLVAFRRDRNLNDILVHGKHNRIFKNTSEERCSKHECAICPIITYDVPATTRIHTDSRNNCETTNVVYGLSCAECNKIVYVGETERCTGERIKEHIADINHRRDKTVAIHFNSGNHTIKDLKVIIIERCRNNSRYYRKTRETYWIERLNTITPYGANKQSLGVLWPDYIVERNVTQNVRAMTSQRAGAEM